MTGEVTLGGQVLPAGGIAEKVLAAHRGGLRRVLLAQRNRKQVDEDLGDDLRRVVAVDYVTRVDAAGVGPAAHAGCGQRGGTHAGRPRVLSRPSASRRAATRTSNQQHGRTTPCRCPPTGGRPRERRPNATPGWPPSFTLPPPRRAQRVLCRRRTERTHAMRRDRRIRRLDGAVPRSRWGNLTVNRQVPMPQTLAACRRRRRCPPTRPPVPRSRPGNLTVNRQVSMPAKLTARNAKATERGSSRRGGAGDPQRGGRA